MTAQSTNPTSLDELLNSWPQEAKETAETVIGKYGPPDETLQTRLVWFGNGPWKRTIVYRDGVDHKWPEAHQDRVEQVIDYRVPVGKFSELARFDGSVIPERTKGEISARCAGEEMNFVALNLAHEVASGGSSADEARAKYVEIYKSFNEGQKPPYTQGLHFEVPEGGTADTDEMFVDDLMIEKLKDKLGEAADKIKETLNNEIELGGS